VAEALVADQAHFFLNNRNHLHHNRHRHVSDSDANLSSTVSAERSENKRRAAAAATESKQPPASSSSKSNKPPPAVRKRVVLNNCTLILLNVFLQSYKTSCDFEDFSKILSHYDCRNNFSVNSNCDKCRVSDFILFSFVFH
jgi:hypothetical protein